MWLAASVLFVACDIDTVPPNANSGVTQDGGHSPGVTTGNPSPIIGINSEVFTAAPIITPPARAVPTRCGDGELDPGERCDPGTDVCCALDCTGPKERGAVCRDAVGPCDVAEFCDGEGLACPEDDVQGEGAVCRKADGDCDAPEACDGVTRQCPDDIFRPATTMCRGARDVCDEAEFCTGESNACPGDEVASAEKECRPQADDKLCDAPEHCDGENKACPPDLVRDKDFPCRTAAGSCDAFALCDGETNECPPLMDGIAPAGAICHVSKGDCDPAEACDGVSPACPEDRLTPASEAKVCRAKMGDCDRAAEVCNGEDAACPPDVLEAAGFVCRAVRGACDVQEVCDGETPECPIDAFAGTERVCKTSAGTCDIAEACNGTSRDCPTDRFDVGRTCKASQGVCDVAEVCGNGPNCPTDAFAVGTTCRARNTDQVCDAAEVCGNAPACPSDIGVTDGRVCRDADDTAALCDADAHCNGSPECPAQNPVAARGTGCRVANGVCDVAESCDGISRQCPNDGFAGSERMCRGSSGDTCDAPEFCNSMGRGCPTDIGVTDMRVCRAASSTAALCDGDAKCNGSPTCPATNPAAPMGTSCRISAGVCDIAETCNGSSLDCPDDDFAGSERRCRDASADPCDRAETCDDEGPDCPRDVGVGDGRVCRDADNTPELCDTDALCIGNSPTCPATNPVAPENTICRGLNGNVCDLAETCNGTSRECPPDVGTGSNAQLRCHDANATRDVCDADTYCNGAPRCPPVQPAPKDRVCHPDRGACDIPEVCGGATTCPPDEMADDGTMCTEEGAPQNAPGQCSMGVCCPGVTKVDKSGFCDIAGATLVFITSRQVNGAFGGLTQGDAICNEAARAANLGGTYAAWLSAVNPATGGAVNARARVSQSGPYVRIDGVKVLDALADLDEGGTLIEPINVDEWGIVRKGSMVWTGTYTDGMLRSPNCLHWTSQDSTAIYGNADELVRGQWTWAGNNAMACKTPDLRLYCFQADAARIDASRAD